MADNKTMPVLTPEFLSSTTEKVVFEPSTMEEVEFIAHQLHRMGYKYYSAAYEKQLDYAIKGSIFLDTDKTIMVSASKAIGIAVNADAFDNLFMPVPDESFASIRPEEVLRGVFAFFPRTTVEARGLLALLKKAGASIDGNEGTFKQAARAVYQGMVVRDGRIDFGPAPEDLRDAKFSSAADLGVGAPAALTAEQAMMMSAFNEMAARMEQMAARIARLEDEILPKNLPKNRAPFPGPKA